MSSIQTFTGRLVEPLRMRACDVDLMDVAHALSNICRFTGHVREFYSVAQHSVLVSLYCEPEDALWGLFHDASEAYLHDLPRPLKRSPQFVFYREAEQACMRVVAEHFGLPGVEPSSVREADSRLLATESRDLCRIAIAGEPYRRRIQPWAPTAAREAFLTRFRTIVSDPERSVLDRSCYVGSDR